MAIKSVFGYQARLGWANRLTAGSKLLGFLLLTTIGMISYDTRFLLALAVGAFGLLMSAGIAWREYRLLIQLVVGVALINLVMIFVLAPSYGVHLYGARDVVFGSGYFALTQQQLLYETNLFLKYVFALPLAIILLFTTHPSEFAAGLNKIGISYKIAYAFALALRYIPDVQSDYQHIHLAQEARGYEISKKASLLQRVKGNAQIILPLVFASLNRIETISQAMALRRFGRHRKRTWYSERPFKSLDWVVLFVVLLIVGIGIVLLIVNHGRFWRPFSS